MSLTIRAFTRGRGSSEAGVALVLSLLAVSLLLAIGGAVLLLAGTDVRLAALERVRAEGRGLAEVQIERAFQDLAQEADWNDVLSGAARSSFRGGTERPAVPGWGTIDLASLTARLNDEESGDWGADRPRWRLYAHGWGADLLAGLSGAVGPYYTAAWVADDEGDGDGRVEVDTNAIVLVRAEAYGPYGSRQILLATIRRLPAAGIELLSLRVPP